jgi:hypothetical protein
MEPEGATQLDNFRKHLNALKEKGVDINPDKVVDEVLAPPTEAPKKDTFDRKRWAMLRTQLNKLLDDFEHFHGDKGRGIGVTVHITKPDNADRFTEKFEFDSNIILLSIQDIGTKGKYEPVVPGE